MSSKVADAFSKQRDFLSRLALMADEANRLGMWKSGHAINDALSVAGFEVADLMQKGQKT